MTLLTFDHYVKIYYSFYYSTRNMLYVNSTLEWEVIFPTRHKVGALHSRLLELR